jgi:hypothetical protein
MGLDRLVREQKCKSRRLAGSEGFSRSAFRPAALPVGAGTMALLPGLSLPTR